MSYPSMIAYRRYSFLRFLTFLFFLSVVTRTTFAGYDGYLGASVSVSQWQMGLASGKKVQFIGTPLDSNKPDPVLTMVGISGSLVYNKTWAFSYMGELGYAQPQIVLSAVDTEQTPPVSQQISASTKILRMDHSIAVNRILGTTGFSIFIGAKVQSYGYNQTDGQYTSIQAGVVTTAPYSNKKDIINYGPAAGMSYSFAIARRVFAALQAGFIYFPGRYSDSNFVTLGPQQITNQSEEKFYGIGVTGMASVVFPLTERLILQCAVRSQYYRSKTLNATQTLIKTTSTTATTSTSSSPGIFDNTDDLLIGGQLTVMYKIF